jgi:tetratricopeptide (TPR) repeat protein
MAVYGLPVLHEDDAVRATRAASEMQEALPSLNERFKADWGVWFENHIGVNTGEVIAGDASLGQRLVTGDAVNTAARLEQNAQPREVLLGDLTYRLARDAVQVEPVEPLTLKGKAEPVPAYRLVSVSAVEHTVRRRQDAPMVGREAEMAALTGLFSTAVDERRCQLATVVGDAGVGKSRLIAEFIARGTPGARVIRGRCLPYGDGITFWPLNEAARDAAGIAADDGATSAIEKLKSAVGSDDVADRLASVMGLSATPYPVPEIYWGARKFLEHLAGPQPVVMVIEDIHWAEATFLELIQHLVVSVESVPVVLLCTGRHELLDREPEWGEGEGAVRLVLHPLTDADAGQVVAGLLGGTGLPEGVQTRIVQSAAGNPLFVEQLLSMLIDNGSLRQTDGGWEQVRDLTALDVPPTIQALLAARLDLLEQPERSVIEPASVIGLTFAQDAVAELVGADTAPEVPGRLESIGRKELIRPSPDSTPEEVAFRFAHVLIRDAAYNGLLKRARADFHERFVDWAEVLNLRQGRGQEFEEIHGYHLEQAYRYLTELGTVDEHARRVGERASEKLSSAGHRAYGRGDMPAAASLLRRAATTRARLDPARLALLPDLAGAFQLLGRYAEAYDVLDEAGEGARQLEDQPLAARVRLLRLFVDLFSGGEGEEWSSRVAAAVDEAIPIFEDAHDEAGLTFAWRLRAGMNVVANRNEESAKAFEQVLLHARAANDVHTETRTAYPLALALVYGPTPVTAAIPRCEDLAERAATDQSSAAAIQALLAQLYSMQGRLGEARALVKAAHARLEDLGATILAATALMAAGNIELRANDHSAAERELRRAFDALSAIGETFVRATVGGLLARVLVDQERADDAERVLGIVEETALPEDVEAQAILAGIRGRLLARKLDAEAAREAAAHAIEVAGQSDSPTLLAEVLIDQGSVLETLGDAEGAAGARRQASGLLDRKGDVLTVAQLRQILPTPP